MRFDAFNCSFRSDSFRDIKDGLETIGAKFIHCDRGSHNFKNSANLEFSGSIHGKVAWGGNGGRIFVEVKGEPSQAWRDWVAERQVADLLGREARREQGLPDLAEWARLKRADVCHDWHDQRDVHDLMPVIRPEIELYVWTAIRRELRWSQFGDWESMAGRMRGLTLSIGSRKSSVYIRIYDKGREMRGKGVEAPDDLRRAEIEFKPRTKSEEIEAVTWKAEMFLGLNYATKALAVSLNISEPPNFIRAYKEPTDAERRKTIVCEQYPTALIDIVSELYDVDINILNSYIKDQKEMAKRARRGAA